MIQDIEKLVSDFIATTRVRRREARCLAAFLNWINEPKPRPQLAPEPEPETEEEPARKRKGRA